MSLWNNTDVQAAKPKFLALGQLTAINVTAGGTGYTPTNGSGALVIAAPGGTGVQATGTVTIVGGVLTSATITNPGSGYTTAPAVTYSTGGSAGTLASSFQAKDSHGPVNSNIVFVSLEEAQNSSNRAKGLKTPGWVEYKEWTDNSGTPRYSMNPLIVMKRANADSGDAADDALVGDVAFVIDTQPVNRSIIAPAGTTFVVAATGATAYQWQVQGASGGAYANIANAGVYSGATTATLTISDVTGLGGKKYRCVVANTTAGASATSQRGVLSVPFGFSSQTASRSVTAPTGTTFVVAATGATTWLWYAQAPAGEFVALTDAGVYSGSDTATLTISDSTGLDGYNYHCEVSDGTTTITSTDAPLTVA